MTDAYETYACEDLRYTVEAFGQAPIDYSSRDGKLLGIPAQLDTAESVAGLYYRADWLDALGMEEPTTVEGVNEMLIALAEHGATVNGGKDTAGQLSHRAGFRHGPERLLCLYIPAYPKNNQEHHKFHRRNLLYP